MHNIDEQMSIVTKRVAELKQEKKRRKYHILSLASAVTCLLLIVGTALVMPDVMERMSAVEYTDIIGFASIFSSGNSFGYLLVALLGFLLGICLTILCIYLRKRSVEDKNNDRDN